MASKTIPHQEKVETMLDRFMEAGRSKKFRKHFESIDRERQLKKLEATMRGSILKIRPEVLEYSIKYVRKNW